MSESDPRIATNELLAIVLAGGRGTRLGALTSARAKPAVPIGGGHRLIDFTLSNCLNSGIGRVGVVTQYCGHTIRPHLARHWSITDRDSQPFAHCLSSMDGADESRGYRGTADAVYRNIAFIREHAPSHVLILAGDHVYRMDYRAMLADHLRSGAQVTVGCVEVPIAEAREFGVMQVDAASRILSFQEKPRQPEPIPGRTDAALASMGIYLFDTAVLLDLLEADAADSASMHDFGKNVIPAALRLARTYAYRLRDLRDARQQGYWRDVGTIDAYFQASFDMSGERRLLDPLDAAWPIRGAAPAPVVEPTGVHPSARAIRCVLSTSAKVGADSLLQDSVLLPGARIGAGCTLRRVIVEPGCQVPDGLEIGLNAVLDRQHFHVSAGGVTVVTREALAELAQAASSSHRPAVPAPSRSRPATVEACTEAG